MPPSCLMSACIRPRRFWLIVVAVLLRHCAASIIQGCPRVTAPSLSYRQWGRCRGQIHCGGSCKEAIETLRAGAVGVDDDEEESSSEDEKSVEEEQEQENISEDTESEEEEDYEEEEDADSETSAATVEYDEPLALPGGLQMGSLFGVMLLSRRMDMFDEKVVRLGRFIFITYLLLYQAFLVYVRIMAKVNNDRTPITMTNPLSGIVNAQLGQKEGGGMVKDLASQFLSSKSTVVEYDLRQAKGMNGSLLFNMLFMWFLHFKMGQTQPLFAQSLTGALNLVYHPLFQVYILGRNLERPFKSNRALPGMPKESSDEADAVATDDEGDEDESEQSEEDNDDDESDEDYSDDDDSEDDDDE